ncbi:MAG: oligosaccharide flippase family protein [Planctomycetota bacterium]
MSETFHPGDLRGRVLRSGGWTLARTVLVALLQAATLIILFRLLEPDDFGAISIVTVVLAIAQAFTQTGVDLALVREGGDVRRYLDSFWSLQVVRGVILGGIIAVLAAPIAIWQGTPLLTDYLLVASLVPILEGLRSVSPILFNRALDQKRPVIADSTCSILSFGALVGLAVWLRSPWAIVINQVFSTLIRSASYHIVHPVRTRFTLRWSLLRRFARFGVGFNLSQSTRYLVDTVDRLLIGRHLGMHTLGIYDRSHVLAHYGQSQLPQFLAAVVFPGFSRVLSDPARFRRLARRFLLTATLGGVAIAGLVRLFDEPLLAVAAGSRSPEILPFFRILLVLAVCRGIALLGHVLLDVSGRPQIQAVCNTAHVLWLVVALPFALATGELTIVCGVAVAGGALNATLTLISLGAVAWARGRGSATPSAHSRQGGTLAPAQAESTPRR